MKIVVVICLTCLFAASFAGADQDIALPKIEAKIGMDVLQAMESRSASRSFSGGEVPLKVISAILWAGYGIILESGDKTVHGYDALSGATSQDRYTIPWGWGDPYLKVYLLLANGAYEYLPEKHKLKFVTNKNLIDVSGSGGSDAYGVIVIAADYNEMPSFNEEIRNVAFMSAGSAAQNMYVAGAVFKIQMLTQVSIPNKALKKRLNLPKSVEPLTILSFGYSD
ncbi:MAG: nitroreductase family protein [Deltaproteobacteria bacterium]|nr:nitroreductase family protein [Deltaproteobacteria bacterium]